MLSKNVNNKKCTPKLRFFNEKKIEKDFDDFWHKKLTLKVRISQSSRPDFKSGIDLPKIFYSKKVLFTIQLSQDLRHKLLKNT